jgi:hypothetical protein
MRKKPTKKMMLAKETVRNLAGRDLEGAAGGLSRIDCTNTNCCSDLAGCGTTACTETQTAGTRLC